MDGGGEVEVEVDGGIGELDDDATSASSIAAAAAALAALRRGSKSVCCRRHRGVAPRRSGAARAPRIARERFLSDGQKKKALELCVKFNLFSETSKNPRCSFSLSLSLPLFQSRSYKEHCFSLIRFCF